MARESFRRQVEGARAERGGGGMGAALAVVPIIELSRYCPGMVVAMGVSVVLTASSFILDWGRPGLEFDAVLVVEPAVIAFRRTRGLRLLYVALTRPTQHLSIVASAALPPALAS
jgi:hypothetical protein